ncbi:MAG: hypothetical protein MUD02_11545 [Bacteroidales bacterium]|jgi:nitrite reductase/ring-hydroxylating ferredoxin subunit|nr:hypothetical protein [Bacteroidales bacterium]MCU0409571.1 hypothetical protein [Bacteroidales bacterium]
MKQQFRKTLPRLAALAFALLVFQACENEKNDVIPDVYVNFTIDLNDPLFLDLNGLGGSAYVSYSTNNIGAPASGYDGNGIIVHAGPDGFYAYDRTCPHDLVSSGTSTRVNVDFMMAICPVCSTSYALAAGGTPASGPGRYPLKNYRTAFDGRYITVWNN